MTLEEIRDEVIIIIQDPDWTDDQIDGYINQALSYTADLINLPDLKQVVSVDTVVSQDYVNLTSVSGGFSGNLRKVIKDGIIVYATLEDMLSYYEDDWDAAGEVESVALEGNILWYQKIPAEAETLILVLYKNPTELVDNDDTIASIPSSLHRLLLAHGAAYLIYNLIEDGIEGEKINTGTHFNLSFAENSKHSGIVKLREHFARRRVHHIMAEQGWGS